MTSQHSEPMDTSMINSPHPGAMQMSSEDREPTQVSLHRKTRENYEESLPSLSKPIEKIDDVPDQIPDQTQATVETVVEETHHTKVDDEEEEKEEEKKLELPQAPTQAAIQTPQIKVAPLMDLNEMEHVNSVPGSVPL